MGMPRFIAFGLLTLPALFCASAGGAALYRCIEGGVPTYSASPCPHGESSPVSIDRATRSEIPFVPTSPQATVAVPHRLTPAERERIVRLRREEPQQSDEARVAVEVEIAAIREGAEARMSREDRATLEALRTQLGSADVHVRAEALTQWRALYARYRLAARPRVQPAPPPLGAENSRVSPPRAPLGATVPGTHGPTVTPTEPPSVALPSRSPPVVDSATGRMLAPAGSDRMIDPMTGTLWLRSGRVYVDPLSGRIIPAP